MLNSRKQVVFTPSVYESSLRRSRRMPRGLVTLITGILIGAGSYWFLQTNYGPQRLSIEESAKLSATVSELTQNKQSLELQLDEAQQQIETLRSEAKAMALVAQTTASTPEVSSKEAEATDPSTFNPITPIPEQAQALQAEDIATLRQTLPPDPANTPVGLRVGNFVGSIGEISYELVLTKRDEDGPNLPARVEMVTEGRYRNGKIGYAHLDPINITADEYVKLNGSVKLTQPTLTPRLVEVRVVNTQNRSVLASRRFDVQAAPAPKAEAKPVTN